MTAEGAAGPGADKQDDGPPTRAPYEVVDARDLAVLARASWPGRAQSPALIAEPRRPDPPAGSELPSVDPLTHLRGETVRKRAPGADLRERAARIPLATWLVAAGAALAVTLVALVPVQIPTGRARQVADTEEAPDQRPEVRPSTTTTARRSAVTTYLPAVTTTTTSRTAPPVAPAPTPTAASPRPTAAPAPARAATPTTTRRTATTSAPRRTTTTRRPAPTTTQAPPPPSEDPGPNEPPPYP